MPMASRRASLWAHGEECGLPCFRYRAGAPP